MALLQLDAITKRFPGVQALANVRLSLRAGEVHALMGQNGAGKSTLIKVLTGVYAADAGEHAARRRDDPPGDARSQAQRAGHQHRLPGGQPLPQPVGGGERLPRSRPAPRCCGPGIDWKAMHADARRAARRASTSTSTSRARSSTYSIAVQQMVRHRPRASRIQAKILILDEPTSSLDEDEVKQLFAVMRELRGEGMAILFVTHFLDQIYEISDRITVLRNGELVGEYPTGELAAPGPGHADGRARARRSAGPTRCPAPNGQPARRGEAGAPARRRARRGAARSSRSTSSSSRGEVLGLGGLLGSGRTETARLLFGIDRRRRGHDRDRRASRSPSTRRSTPSVHGIGFCPEDRKLEGIVARPLRPREHRRWRCRPSAACFRVPRPRTRRRRSPTATSSASASRPPTPRRPSRSSPAATSRRRCSPAGWPPIRACSSSTSRRAASTWRPSWRS